MNKTSILILLVCILAGLCGCNTPPWKEYVLDPGLRITQLDRQVIGDIRTREPHLGLPTALEKFQDERGTPALRIYFGEDFYGYTWQNGSWVLTSEGYRISDPHPLHQKGK
jgi:hypothetical protein